ncbi:MAG: 50S ribosomal protein L22, partial [Nitrospinae bacterium]|nr:50S ribosomal protein L22 [Nitrospinota bacterium]
MEAIEASATLRFHRISQQKAKLVADMIRGRKVEDAVRALTFTDKRGARVMLKLLKSAIANAEVKNVEDPELLQVSRVWVNKGPY